jgi:hypothetical protein
MSKRTSLPLLAAAAFGGLAFAAAIAQANVVTTGSAAFTVTDDVPTAITGGPSALLGSVTLSNFAFSGGGTTFTMQLAISNNTNAALFPSGRLTAFGFNTLPDASSVSDTSAIFDTFLESNFPSFMTVDVCTSTGPTCAGGGGGDLAPGATNTFTLTLNGLPAGTSSIDLGAETIGAPENFDFKWQTGIGSFESQCTFGGSCGTIVDAPEPASLALLGTAITGFGVFMRRRRRS